MYTEKAYHFVISKSTGIEIMVLAKSFEEALAKLDRDSIIFGYTIPTIYSWYTTE